MTNQTHPLFVLFGVGSDDCAAPRANDFMVWARTVQAFIDTVVPVAQHHLPDCPLSSEIHTQPNA